MRFQWPVLLWGVALIPLLSIAYLAAERRRDRVSRRFSSEAMLPNVVRARPGWRRHVPPLLMLLAVAALLVGMARPEAALSVPRERATVLLAIDSSNSMLASDVEPSRMVAAQTAGRNFLKRIPDTFQVGVVTFAGRAITLSAPTIDRQAVREALNSLETTAGTKIGDGLALALEARELVANEPGQEPAPMVVLLLSDGNDTGSDVPPLEAAGQARELGIKVHTIALGVGEGFGPNGRRFRGPNIEELRAIANTTGGRFFATPTAEELNQVYRSLGSSLGRTRQHREITVAFVGGGALLLALSGIASAAWFKRVP
ncbi:MAG TPA: VWA domain-containing protein [Actinomycetota bacterium]|jgi:Ca-activated chloride channel family protein|nr:VWA domain-containing protein [Actinomycetota bacterium]